MDVGTEVAGLALDEPCGWDVTADGALVVLALDAPSYKAIYHFDPDDAEQLAKRLRRAMKRARRARL